MTRFCRQAVAFVVLLSLSGPALAGLSSRAVFEVRQTGSDTNGGGFTMGGMIAAPSAPSVSNITTGGSVAANTYYVVTTYTDAIGETVISGESTTTTTGATSTITVTSPSAATGANTWSAYFATTSGGPYWPQGTGLTIGSNRSVTTTPPTSGTQPRGVDYSVQDSPQVNVADGVANGTTTFTSATAGFTGSHVGNLIRIGSTSWRAITAVASATSVTLDATVSTNTSLPVVIGGAYATVGNFMVSAPPQNSIVYVKYNATAYTMSASTNVAGGSISNGSNFTLVGYNTTRTPWNTDASRPTIKPSANSVTMVNDSDNYIIINNVIFANPGSQTSCTAFNGGNAWTVTNCRINNYNTLHGSDNYSIYSRCDISVATQSALGSFTRVLDCDVHDGGGLQIGQAGIVARCNFYNISGTGGKYCVQCNSTGVVVENCNFYHQTTSGQSLVAAIQLSQASVAINCVAEDITPSDSAPGYMFDSSINGGGTLNLTQQATNCFAYNLKTANASPANVAPAVLSGITTLTASPFTLPGSANFAPNSTAGGGAVIRGASLPTVFPAGTTTQSLDAGAVQDVATSGGGFIPGPLFTPRPPRKTMPAVEPRKKAG